MFKWLIALPICISTALAPASSYATVVPAAAGQYQRMLTREARAHWGLSAPIALFAGQIHQESAWRPEVCSPFACGLTQFTESTADWISGLYKEELGANEVFNPQWAIRAMVLYDRWIYHRVPTSASDFERWAFTLSSYNGGLGWVSRDARICAATPGCDPSRWFGHVERHSNRAAWAFRENRGYPDRILNRHQSIYKSWGPTVEAPEASCSAA